MTQTLTQPKINPPYNSTFGLVQGGGGAAGWIRGNTITSEFLPNWLPRNKTNQTYITSQTHICPKFPKSLKFCPKLSKKMQAKEQKKLFRQGKSVKTCSRSLLRGWRWRRRPTLMRAPKLHIGGNIVSSFFRISTLRQSHGARGPPTR